MKYVKQFMIILAFSFAGEMLKSLLPFPIPASIYGLVLLFVCLEAGWLKLGSIVDVSKYLVEIMPLMFIPAGVGLMESWGVLQPVLVKIAVVVLVSTVLVMAVAGRMTQLVIRLEKRKAGQKSHE